MKNTEKNQSKNPLVQAEEDVLAFWEKNKIFAKQVDCAAFAKGSGELRDYVFYDGPPFATGTPHYGHLVASLMKDAVPRFWAMNGYRVERNWGWDCHGLPIENIVEKELGFKTKKDIIAYGIDKFNQRCRERVLDFAADWEKTISRLGRWVDFDHGYKTMDLNYMESVWWVFKQLYDKDLIYEGYRSMHICPRCETTLSQSEVAEGYRDIKDLSCVAKFELVDEPGTFVLAWTTTPWTLIGNVALAVGKNIDYVVLEIKNQKSKIKNTNQNLKIGEKYIFSKAFFDLRNKDFDDFEVDVKKIKGKDLIGKKYQPLFDYYFDTNEQLLDKQGDSKECSSIVILDKNNKILLGLREYTKDKKASDFNNVEIKDFWINPGGRSESGESFRESIARELREECNISDFRIKKYLSTASGYAKEDRVNWFLAEVDDLEQIRNNEPDKFKEWKFFDLKDIPAEGLMSRDELDIFKKAIEWNNSGKIYSADFVTTEDGTGVVHIAPAFGEDDLNFGKEHNLTFVQHVGMDGIIKPEAGEFAGMNVKPIDDHTKTDVEIIKYLAKNNLLFDKAKYEHSYPHCWRCDTPLFNYATGSWFVSVEKIKESALTTAQEINWSPEHIKAGRFGQWLEGARDWSISRQRFWASCIPIWKCADCGKIKVFGSIAELEKAGGKTVKDLHKDVLDKIEVECECGGMMRRVPDVLDTWFDSGSMPYAQMHYDFDNQAKFEANFPAQFIAEGVDQTRAWFYYLHIIANGIFQKPAFKNVIVNGIVLAEDGKKMSKKLANYPDPNLILEKYGADALRGYLLSSPVMQAENLNFSEKGVEESLRKNVMVLWNVYKFYETYEDKDQGPMTNDQIRTKAQGPSGNILEKWIVSKFDELLWPTLDVAMKQDYDLSFAMRSITEFIDDLSTWYLRRSRDRFKSENIEDKNQALATTKYILENLAKAMAPFLPFIAETLWQKVSGYNFKNKNKSVHLESWPTPPGSDKQIIEEMERVRVVVSKGLAKRDEAGIKVRQKLNKFTIHHSQFTVHYLDLIKDELNVNEVICVPGDGELAVELDTVITPELELDGLKRDLVRAINNLRKEAGLTVKDRITINYQDEQNILEPVLAKFKAEILAETLADEIIAGDVDGGTEVKLGKENISLKIKKI